MASRCEVLVYYPPANAPVSVGAFFLCVHGYNMAHNGAKSAYVTPALQLAHDKE